MPPEKMPPESLLQSRAATHGSFQDNARIAQYLRTFFRDQPQWTIMTEIQREALDNIALKLSRILSGQASFQDHWDDISGYAQLAARDIHAE